MAGYFKKRRSAGPSKNEERVRRARADEDQKRRAGTLATRFPEVESLKLDVAFLDARGNELDRRALSLVPSSPVAFSQACPGRCGHGTLDLAASVAEAVAARRALSESSVKCAESLYAGSAETCGVEAKIRIDIRYAAAATPPAGA